MNHTQAHGRQGTHKTERKGSPERGRLRPQHLESSIRYLAPGLQPLTTDHWPLPTDKPSTLPSDFGLRTCHRGVGVGQIFQQVRQAVAIGVGGDRERR
ncbi:MAG: hypothetical protein AAB676_14930 [Verrucomicrobiota bacterium]